MGARFFVPATINVESVGGYFAPMSSGNIDPGGIFAAIVALDDQDDMPDSLDLSTPDVVSHTIVDIDWGDYSLVSRDYTTDLQTSLEPGWYVLLFGSGLFGTSVSSNTAAIATHIDVGNPDFVTRRELYVHTYTTMTELPTCEDCPPITWESIIENYNCVDYSLVPGEEFCTYASGSEWQGDLEWADDSTPSAYGWFNGPNNPGSGMRFFINASVTGPVVNVDVLPDDATNKVYPNKLGKMPVAFLSSDSVDAAQVDPATVRFGLGEAASVSEPVISDIDGQSGADLVLEFRMQDSGIFCNDTEVSMSGRTYAGDVFVSSDTIDASECEDSGCHFY